MGRKGGSWCLSRSFSAIRRSIAIHSRTARFSPVVLSALNSARSRPVQTPLCWSSRLALFRASLCSASPARRGCSASGTRPAPPSSRRFPCRPPALLPCLPPPPVDSCPPSLPPLERRDAASTAGGACAPSSPPRRALGSGGSVFRFAPRARVA